MYCYRWRRQETGHNLDRLIKQSPLLIHCPDFDEAGLKAVSIWQNYPQYLRYPTPFAKSVGDAYLQGLSVRDWILGALKDTRTGN